MTLRQPYRQRSMNPHPRVWGESDTALSYDCVTPKRAGDVGSCAPTPNSSLLTPNWTYTFSAKERDSETGLSYFGSRYYSSDLSIWLSVDPMAAKYASLSPYTYCANNPVKLVDPNGEEIGGPDDPPTKYIIKKGDTFWNLENARNLPHGTLQRQNPSLDPNNLQVGTEINYPYMQGDLIISDNSVPTGDIPEYYNQPTSSGPVMDMSNYNAVSPLIAMMGIQDPLFLKEVRLPMPNSHIRRFVQLDLLKI